MPRWVSLALAGSLLAGCAAGSREDVASMIATATPPTGEVKARLATDGGSLLLYPYAIQDPEISYVGAMSNGSRWVCVRALTGSPVEGFTRRHAIAVLGSDTTLIGTQTNCPTCTDPALRWLPFPELEGGAELAG